MPLPQPKIGDTNVRGYILASTVGHEIEALESLYGQQNPDGYNPLLFDRAPYEPDLPPEGTEILFDLIAAPASWFYPPAYGVATNIRPA